MDQNTFFDNHVMNITGAQLNFKTLIEKLNTDVYGREMRNDISRSVQALGNAVNELHDKGGSGSGVGWTDAQIDLLEEILQAAAYADTGIGDKINRLIASLRGNQIVSRLTVIPTSITVSAGDSVDSIHDHITVKVVKTDGYEESEEETVPDSEYKLDGVLIQGKDCPFTISYAFNGITYTVPLTVTVRERTPKKMTVRFFDDIISLPIGTTSAEVQDAIYAQLIYDDGYGEVIQDLLLDNKTVVNGKNSWAITSGLYPWIHAYLEFYGTMYSPIGNARIVYLLEGCSSTNTEEEIAPGTAFKTFISADYGSIASLKVFVDGTDFTGLVAPDGKTIDIQSIYVTMNGRIIISAIASTDYNITYHLTNCTSLNVDATISLGSTYQTYIQPNEGYELDLTEAKTYAMMGHQVFPAGSDGKIFIPKASNNIDIYGVAKPESGGEVTLTSISASYTGGTVPAGTTLDQLNDHLTVTAHYSDGSTATVPDYSLSGTLTSGQTNTITVTYQGKTATFSVTVEAESSTETYDLVWNNTTATANDTSMTGFNTLGSTYADALSAVTPNKYAAVSNLITYNASKTYVFKATTLAYGIRFQYGFFDASGNLVAYTDFDAIGDVGNTVPTTITLNGSTVTRNKNGTITTETINTGSVANIAVFVRGKREVPHGSKLSSDDYAFEWSVSG